MKLLILAVVAALAVANLPNNDDIFLNEDHEPGFIKVKDDGSDLFYWLFRSRGNTAEDPLVFWLQGGPGCSSELAVFFENGPFTINDDLTLQRNDESWNSYSNIVFIDQPTGTGFSNSVGEMDTNEVQVG